ncbi:MAG: efflux RND transporter permease subunit, partial [Minisyncoccia bacterium]
LTRVGLETIALVMLSLLLTIGWRESIVAAVSIPLSFLIAFVGLWLSGNTINFISLFALILAIGILIDGGIVVTEAIHTRMRQYASKEEAAEAALREYAWPLIAGTMATVAVFAPLFFISGIVGEFIASIPFTLIFVLIASIFVALGIVPLVAIMFTKKDNNALEQRQEEYTHEVQEWYRRKLGDLLDSRRLQNMFLWSIGIAFLVSLALPISGLLKTTFFPQEDIDFIFIEIEKPEGTTLAETDLVTRQVEEILYEVPNTKSFVTTVGSGSAFNASGGGTGAKLANITILLTDPNDREETSSEIVADLRERVSNITSATIRVSEPNNGPPTGAPVLITFSGDDLGKLEEVTTRAQRILGEIEGATEITSSMKDNGLQVRLVIDRAKAAAVGLTPLQVAQTLRTAVNGTTATTIRGETDIDVVVKLDLNPAYTEPSETTHVDPDALGTLTIPTPRGPVLLGSVVETELQKGNAAISHEDRKRIASVSAQVGGDTTAIEATSVFTERMATEPLPEGVTMKIGGETEDVNKSFAEMGFAFLAGLVLMISIMVMQFNSLRHALYLILMVILSLIGVFGGLFITAQTLSFSSVIGIIALAGVIINHAIILTDSIHRLSKRGDLSPRQAVIEASVSRLRPIVLTTITTVVGMIPLAGASSLWGPLAFAIMFGLSFSMILTLALVPMMTYRWPGNWFTRK